MAVPDTPPVRKTYSELPPTFLPVVPQQCSRPQADATVPKSRVKNEHDALVEHWIARKDPWLSSVLCNFPVAGKESIEQHPDRDLLSLTMQKPCTLGRSVFGLWPPPQEFENTTSRIEKNLGFAVDIEKTPSCTVPRLRRQTRVSP